MAGNPYAAACAHTKRVVPDMTANKEIAEAIGKGFRILPIYEKSLYEWKYIDYYSLRNNEYLRCRWAEYCRTYDQRVFAPYEFVDIRNFHFHNGDVRLKASESLHKATDFRLKLKPGPGVDFRGQKPIPNEMVMQRAAKSPRAKPLLKRKEKHFDLLVDRKTDK